MSGELLCIGISHKTAPVELRERVALITADARRLCERLVALPVVSEAVALSTCSRTEVYLFGDAARAEPPLLEAIVELGDLDPGELRAASFRLRGIEAAEHLFNVSAGLDSMIPGESEIQGQVRRAHDLAHEWGTTGPLTDRLFHAALRAGRRVRSETLLASGHASVPSVAVALAEEVVSDLASSSVLIVGAGETSELTAQALAARGARPVFATRRAERAQAAARRFGGEVAALTALPELLCEADIVVAGTASPHTLIHATEVQTALEDRAGRPLVLIDLAVPRDIDPACALIDGVSLYDIDDVETAAKRTLQVREEERDRGAMIVAAELHRFESWLDERDLAPVIAALRKHGNDIVERVLADNDGQWESVSPRDRARIEALARSVMQRLLHDPTVRLKDPAPVSGSAEVVLRELFSLRDQGDGLADVHDLRPQP